MASKKGSNGGGKVQDLTPTILRDIRRNTGDTAAGVKRVEAGLEHVEKEIIRLRQELHADVVARIQAVQAAADAKYRMLEQRVASLERRR